MAKQVRRFNQAAEARRRAREQQEALTSADPPPIPTPQPALANQDRMTLHITATHEQFGEQPVQVQNRYWSFLETTGGQSYQRRDVAGPEWRGLDFGYCEQPGMVWIENRAGTGAVVQPTPEEQADISSRVVQVRIGGGRPLLVLPGQAQQLLVEDPKEIEIYCCKPTKINVTIFPR